MSFVEKEAFLHCKQKDLTIYFLIRIASLSIYRCTRMYILKGFACER